VKDWLRSLYSNYRLHADLQANLQKQEIIIVHQMGKVGSTSVVESLEASELAIPVYHSHSLNIEHLKQREQQKQLNHQRVPPRLVQGQYLRKAIDQRRPDQAWKIVSLVRDPISRNVSAFFQNIEDYFPNFCDRYDSGQLTLENVVTTFLEKYDHGFVLTWFDREVKDVFGIDVFSTSFPQSKGYEIFKGQQVDLLVLRLEDLNRCSQDAFQDFLGIKNFTLQGANLSERKDYKDVYNQFKALITLPNGYIDQLCHSQLMRHFYNDDEINAFRLAWSRLG
jgi:hypothetical protein